MQLKSCDYQISNNEDFMLLRCFTLNKGQIKIRKEAKLIWNEAVKIAIGRGLKGRTND
jgi:hypothetical protein